MSSRSVSIIWNLSWLVGLKSDLRTFSFTPDSLFIFKGTYAYTAYVRPKKVLRTGFWCLRDCLDDVTCLEGGSVTFWESSHCICKVQTTTFSFTPHLLLLLLLFPPSLLFLLALFCLTLWSLPFLECQVCFCGEIRSRFLLYLFLKLLTDQICCHGCLSAQLSCPFENL